MPVLKRQTVASCQSAATGSSSASKLALRRQRQIRKRKDHRQSIFLRNLQIPGRHKKPTNAFDKVLSGLNAILLSEEDAELVNPHTSTKYLESPKSPASPTVGRRRQSTVILHQLKGVESKAKKKKYRKLLQSITLFEKLSDDDTNKIIDNLKVRLFTPGQYICRQGSVGDSMFIVETGTVIVSLKALDPDDERKKVVKELPITIFGEIALMTDNKKRECSRKRLCQVHVHNLNSL